MIQCAACGGTNVQVVWEDSVYKPVYAPEVAYRAPLYRCGDCTESYPTGEHDAIVEKVYDDAHKAEIRSILGWLESQGYSRLCVERLLRLPWNTLVAWEVSGPGPGGLMLLRFVRRDPSLLYSFPGTV